LLSKAPEGKYSEIMEIGAWGMKSILMVKDRDTGRDVAMAAIRDATKSDNLHRFIHEAKLAANLEHPNIVPIHDIGLREDGKPFSFPNWTRLVYAGNGLFSSEEDVYNPARDAPATLSAWIKAGGSFESDEQVLMRHR